MDDFTVNFFADAVVCAIERWLLGPDCMPPEQFVNKNLLLLKSSADVIQREMGAGYGRA